MKIAITSQGQDLNASIDPRFGRAQFILIVEADTLEFEVIDNSVNVNAFKGAGIKAASTVADSGADVLLTGYCGPNAFKTLTAAGLKVVNDISGTVGSVVKKFSEGEYAYSEAANVDGHW